MRKSFYIYLIFCLLMAGCAKERQGGYVENTDMVSIKLFDKNFSTRVVDEDNLAIENTIVNVAIFLTEPYADDITFKFIDPGFSTSDDYRIVTIPLEPEELGTKDIYIVANYGSVDFTSVNTVTSLRELKIPAVDKTNNLDPAKGFCMFGKTRNFNFNDGSGDPAIVGIDRTCAKLRFTMVFPDDPQLSTDNSFLITEATSYTFIVNSIGGMALPTNSYFNFASEIPLDADGERGFTGIAYVYESSHAPVVYFYTHINDSPATQEYMANLPFPVRNYLYDITVRVYEDTETRPSVGNYRVETDITIYDDYGNKI